MNKFKKIQNGIKISLLPIILTLFLLSFGNLSEQKAFAHNNHTNENLSEQKAFAHNNHTNEKNEYMDFQKYTGNRLLVFNDTRVDYCVTKNDQNPKFNDIAIEALKTWHDRIVEVTKNSEVWDMTMHIFPKNESICDGYVNFFDTPDPAFFQLTGVAGFSHPQTPVANVTIYTDNYQKTLREMSQNNEKFWENITLEEFQAIIKNTKHEQYDLDTIKRVTLHEIGHSLSLNHPNPTDGDLRKAPGIMGYNMTYNHIDTDEVLNIVKAYPNGFAKVSNSESIKLDGNYNKKILTLGETVNLTIEIPKQEGKLPPAGIEVLIFPEGTSSLKTERAPIKIIDIPGQKQLVNNSDHLKEVNSIMAHWGSSAKVLSIQFKVIKEFENADMIVITHDVGGFEKQWFLKDVLTVKKALFSDELLDIETTEQKFYLMGSNPNRLIEKETAFKIKQEQLFNEALSDCLINKNMKKCSNEIRLNDFKQVSSSPALWTP